MTIKTTTIRIPKVWEQIQDGRFKTSIPYRDSYGTINAESIPDCVVLIGSCPTCIILYSDCMPIIPDGACLTFTKR